MKVMNNVEAIRTLKAMQTDTLQKVAALRGLATEVAGDSDFDQEDGDGLYGQIVDAEKTARTHAQALGHAIDKLAEHMKEQA